MSDKGLQYSEFLDSDTISLQARGSKQSFRIHKALLRSKSEALISAFDSEFKENQSRAYVCEETTDGTLIRFIEWAYTGDYPDLLQSVSYAKIESNDAQMEPKDEDKAESMPEFENHPLLVHLELYIFADTYIVRQLKQVAFEKITACFIRIDKPRDLDTQLASIAIMKSAFRRIPSQDGLLKWLAQYAAYCLDQLRLQPALHDLLCECPMLSSQMIAAMKSASQAPWHIQPPAVSFPSYEPQEQKFS